MKKIISVLCVVAMLATLACVGVAADGEKFVITATAGTVNPGDDTLVVEVKGILNEGTLAGYTFDVSYDSSAMVLTGAEKGEANGGMYQNSKNVDENPYRIIWVGIDEVPTGKEFPIATLTFKLAAPAEVGSTYTVNFAFDPDNAPIDIDDQPVEAFLTEAVVVEVAEPATDAPATDAPATDAPKTDAPATDAPKTDAPATEAPATDAPATTANNNNGTPQTGDMMLVVAILMVVALGAAVVVKKVNAK